MLDRTPGRGALFGETHAAGKAQLRPVPGKRLQRDGKCVMELPHNLMSPPYVDNFENGKEGA